MRRTLKRVAASPKESGYLKDLEKDGIIVTDRKEHKNENL
jgi:hypothetical protein